MLSERTSTVAVADRLSAISVRGYQNVHTMFSWSERVDPDRFAMSEELLPLRHHPLWAQLSDEQKHKMALYEATHFFSINIAGERELMMGLVRRFQVPAFAALTEYLQHFVHEENAHSQVFTRFCRDYAGRIYPDRQIGLPRSFAPGEEDFLFFAKVMAFEEIADFYNVSMAKDDSLWQLSREINEYHHLDEGRHLAFGRRVLEELWDKHAGSWGAGKRAALRTYLSCYTQATLRGYVNPQVYRDLGLAQDALQLRAEALAMPARAAINSAATRRLDKFFNSFMKEDFNG